MALRYVLDTNDFGFRVSRAPEPRYNNKGEHRTDRRSGFPLYAVQVIAEFADGAEVLSVSLPSEAEPKLSKGQTVRVENLEVVPWLRDDRGVKTLATAWRAEKITPAPEKPAK